MKTARNLALLFGLALALLAFAATKANAQDVGLLTGTFTLPFDAQWGSVTLPAGDYRLNYGHSRFGTYTVEVVGEDERTSHGFILIQAKDKAPVESKTVLVCIREGDAAYIRELRMGVLGESVTFAPPSGVVESKIISKNAARKGDVRIARAQTRVDLPVRLNAR